MNRIIGFRITGRKWSLIILMFNPILCDNSFYVFFVFWPPLRETLGLEFQFFFFSSNNIVLEPSSYRKNTAYHPPRESITHKDFGKFTQQGISFDEGATYPNYLPL